MIVRAIGALLGFGSVVACNPPTTQLVTGSAPVVPLAGHAQDWSVHPLQGAPQEACGYRHEVDDALWFVEAVGGGYVLANIDGVDVRLGTVVSQRRAPPGAEVASYAADGVHVDVLRRGDAGRIAVRVAGESQSWITAVAVSACS